MSPFLVAMTQLGCIGAGDACHPLRVLPARFATVSACYAASNDVLVRLTTDDAPVVAIRCHPIPATTLASR